MVAPSAENKLFSFTVYSRCRLRGAKWSADWLSLVTACNSCGLLVYLYDNVCWICMRSARHWDVGFLLV